MADPVYEMLWDCPRCGTEKLLGLSHRHCPNCGAAQDPDTRYFPEEEDKVAVEDHVYAGRDLACAHCETPNSRAANNCVNCGAPLGEGENAEVALVEDDPAEEPSGEQPSGEEPAADEAPPARSRKRGCTALGAIAILLVGLVAVGAAVMCFWTRSETVEVTGHDWQRQIAIERFDRVRESDWCDRMPTRATSVTRSEKQRDTRRVEDGEDCRVVRQDRGDGTFAERTECSPRYREEPVYDAWCDYRVERWVHDRWVNNQGSGLDPPPSWPTVTVDDCRRIGCTRRGSRRDTYTVHLRDSTGEAHRCDLSEDRWRRMGEGSRWSAEVRVMTGGVACGSLEPA